MGLYLIYFYSRTIVTNDDSFINWKDGNKKINNEKYRYEGRVMPIHEGGMPYGEKMAVFHSSRTDIEFDDDLPDISQFPTDENTISKSWERSFEGRKLFRIMGELWKNEWIDPGKLSTRIKGDSQTSTIHFIVDEEGNRESEETLVSGGRWLWFKPEVVMSIANQRGGNLSWYTRDTGGVGGAPDTSVHFGVNNLGLVNVYAKDIALLPTWLQQIWAGFNIAPEGGVSEELLSAQVRAIPANTQAPEDFFKHTIEKINEQSKSELNIEIFRDHDSLPEIYNKVHRFRAFNESGLFALAKDVARLTADSIDSRAIQTIVPQPPGTNWGSLKSLENLLAKKIKKETARNTLSPLVGIYELRHADAHLPSKDIEQAYNLIGIDRKELLIKQGYSLIHTCVASLTLIGKILSKWQD